MKKYILLILSLVMDISLLNIMPFRYLSINYLFPMLFVSTLFLVYPLFDNDKKYFLSTFIISIIYGGLLYNNILLGISSILLISLFTKIYNKYININNLTMVIGLLLVIIINDLYIYSLLSFFVISNFYYSLLFYKIKRSIFLNLLYGLVIYNLSITSSSKNIF